MRILLDTHAFLWWDDEPERLSKSAFALCSAPHNVWVLSVASVWELQIKYQLGKLTLCAPLSQIISDQQRVNALELLPVMLPHVFALENLPPIHKDPFDRLLIAQSLAENIPVLSVDSVFKDYPISLLSYS